MGLPTIPSYDLPAGADLPIARAPWRLDPARAALLIHDMQGYFTAAFESGASPLEPLVVNIARLKRACAVAAIPVFYTAQNGDQDRRDRGLQADLWGPGMSAAPHQQGIEPALAPEAPDLVLVKHRYSAFQRSHLAELMRVRGRDQLIISGIYAHIGCLMTAGEAFQRDIEPFLVADAIADFSRQKHDMALAYVAATCGVPVTTDAVVAGLAAGAAR